jgi:ABC-type nitrate/sulfonate/bicarbonate transport system substrate-binding protein
MKFPFIVIFFLVLVTASPCLNAQQRHLHSSAGVGSNQIPMYVANDLGLFEKYGLNVI